MRDCFQQQDKIKSEYAYGDILYPTLTIATCGSQRIRIESKAFSKHLPEDKSVAQAARPSEGRNLESIWVLPVQSMTSHVKKRCLKLLDDQIDQNTYTVL
jgi:hypothetical protein